MSPRSLQEKTYAVDLLRSGTCGLRFLSQPRGYTPVLSYHIEGKLRQVADSDGIDEGTYRPAVCNECFRKQHQKSPQGT